MSLKKRSHRVIRFFAWFVGVILILVMMTPVLLYVPLIQDIAKDIAVSQVRKATGWDLSIERVRLRWPIRLSVDRAVVVPVPGDTMLNARRLDVGVAIWPLLKGQVNVDYARLDSAFYQLGTPDSTLWLRAKLNRFDLEASNLTFKLDSILLSDATLDGADIRLVMRPDTTVIPPDTAATRPMVIFGRHINLRNVRFAMSMRPTIDSINVLVPEANLYGGLISMADHRINARELAIDSVSGFYLFPAISAPTAPPTRIDSVSSAPWTITADSLRLSATRALYAMTGAKPAPGLDFNYIQVSDVSIAVDHFFNRGSEITVPLAKLTARERCGLTLDASGTFAITTDGLLRAKQFNVATNTSTLAFDASMGMGSPATDPDLPMKLQAQGRLSLSDVALAFPAMRPAFVSLPAPHWIEINADVDGSPALMNITTLSARYPGLLNVDASGKIANPFDAAKLRGSLDVSGSLTNAARLQRSPLLAKLLGPDIQIPARLAIDGSVNYAPGPNIDGDISLRANDGTLAATGFWKTDSQSYNAIVNFDNFPVEAFMPSLGVADLTADITAGGKGFDPLDPLTSLKVDMDVVAVRYNQHPLSNIKLIASLADSRAEGLLRSMNPDADLDIEFDATLADSSINWELDGDIRRLDLHALNLVDSVMNGSMQIASTGSYQPKTKAIDAGAAIHDLDWRFGQQTFRADRLDIGADLSDSLIHATASNGDLRLNASAYCSLDSITPRLAAIGPVILRQVKARRLDVDSIRMALPPLDVSLTAGADNMLARYMANSGISWQSIGLTAQTDSLIRINARMLGFKNPSTSVDTISLNAIQRGKFLIYNARMGNRPGTMDEFARINLNGYVGDDRLSVLLRQQNIKGQTGFSLGLLANVTDSTASVKFLPYNPTIAYKHWTVNEDNSITYNFLTDRMKANLDFTGENDAFLRIFTEQSKLDPEPTPGQIPYNDIVIQIARIKVQDWLAVNPFAPPVKGDLRADLRLNWNRKALTGLGNIGLDNFTYDNQRVGSFLFDVNLHNDPVSKAVRADLALMVDSVKTLTLKGLVNDSTASNPFLLDVNLIHLPLKILNPFLPGGVARLKGSLNGKMDMTGTPAKPILNGFLQFDSTTVNVPMLGQDFTFADTRIPVDSNIVRFDDFAITAANKNPLTISGSVDAAKLTDIALNLNLQARNMMLIDRQRPRGADVYGKAYIDADANVHGSLASLLWVNANLTILGGTNATYVMPGGTTAIQSLSSSSSDMVKFVNFNDTTQVISADSIQNPMGLVLNAQLAIEEGTTLAVDLSADGKNKASLQPQGNLTFSMSPLNSGRLTGRLTFDKGFVRYTPPLMSEKLFNIQEGSYVAFNGDMLNPILNLHAVDVVKANVTQQGQNSRLVNFDIALDVTNTLQNMNVAFDLSTDDDITVQNELQSMTREQRASQAINMLLYNIYSGPGTTGNASLGGNALFSFLESKINSWAASTIPGVDISFGIEQYDRIYDGTSSTATSYSYRVSKSLFNDRFKIIVGGNYTTDANADENFSQNLINDISFEYLLNRSGTMYVRLFRHTGYESILEGEVTQTGVGFVFRRKLNSLRDLFRWKKPSKKTSNSAPASPIDNDAKND